ncbi:MAG: exosome complex protein Rrp42 [Candidatus Heimdallarchaeota archaeon]|nr:MAG: exosome complex protein Rrp42 [Candidatus Heimdallarchaeota archaeon]
MRSDDIIASLEKKYLTDLLSKGQRMDNRGFWESRPIQIVPNVIKKAEGSAMVKWGDTVVLAGVKAQLGSPFPDTPNDGVITVNLELSPISSPSYESGPPGPLAIEMARVVDRGIRESKVIPMNDPKLCVIPGKTVWILFVDIYILDDGGNLIDVSALAAMAALANTRLNKVLIDEETEEATLLEETEPLPRNGSVASLTYVKIDDLILYDPNLIEDRGKIARFSVAITNEGFICSMQKGETGVFLEEEIITILEKASDQVKPLIEIIEKNSQITEHREMFRFDF